MVNEAISEKQRYPSKYIEVLGSNMHYVEVGSGNPILFLHGVPTSCFLWRNVMPHLSTLGRCIAPDLIGMGRSDKPDIDYTVFDHIRYIEQFINALNLKNITLVMHAWGSVIGLDYAMRHEDNCKGLVLYEPFLRSLRSEESSLPLQEQLMLLEDEIAVSNILMRGADFVDKTMSQHVIRQLTDSEREEYRMPFEQEGAGKPLLQYLLELSSRDGKDKVDDLISHYTEALSKSRLPKLLFYSVPGFITPIANVMWAKNHMQNLEMVDIGEELHFAQETQPGLIGKAISAWLQGMESKR